MKRFKEGRRNLRKPREEGLREWLRGGDTGDSRIETPADEPSCLVLDFGLVVAPSDEFGG